MAEMADTATEPTTIPPAIFQKRAGDKNTFRAISQLQLDKLSPNSTIG